MRDIMKLALRLLVITLVAGLLLGLTDAVTRDAILEQTELEANEARQAVLPEAQEFESVAGSDTEDTDEQEVYRGIANGETVGYTVKLACSGYGGDILLTVGIKADGTVGGVRINSHSETPGLGAKAVDPAFIDQYAGQTGALSVVKTTPQGGGEIQAITGATITSRAVTQGVSDALTICQTLLDGGDSK